MKYAEKVANRGSVTFFLVDQNLLSRGGDDSEKDLQYREANHPGRKKPKGTSGRNIAARMTTFLYPTIGWLTFAGLTWARISDED
jgi:hypothetical protein